jgi:hypothetical protein
MIRGFMPDSLLQSSRTGFEAYIICYSASNGGCFTGGNARASTLLYSLIAWCLIKQRNSLNLTYLYTEIKKILYIVLKNKTCRL